MSLKGKQFIPADLSPSTRRALRTDKAIAAHCAEQTERYRIVAKAKDGAGYIAEELQERALRTLSPQVRVLATQALFQLTAEQRLELKAAFDAKGDLVTPFERV